MKTIICLWGHAGIGKTSAIKAIYDKLNFSSTPPIGVYGDDFYAIVPYCNSTVGIASMGDSSSQQGFCLNELDKAGCEVIICASRTKRGTVYTVENLAQSGGYKLIWLSPFSSEFAVTAEPFRKALNDATANAVIELVRKCLCH